ncbi:MAG: transcriptional regulator NrdR [Planctomycetota bacterium]
MICPYCNANDDKVIDSRSTEAGKVIRRRRHCLNCDKRFTTYERIETANRLVVVKKDGSRDPFDLEKVLRGVVAACGKRKIPEEDKQRLVDLVDEELHAEFEREVPSTVVGERVMAKLRQLDQVAYVRYATEHLNIDNLPDLKRELDDLMERPVEMRDQQGLFLGEEK